MPLTALSALRKRRVEAAFMPPGPLLFAVSGGPILDRLGTVLAVAPPRSTGRSSTRCIEIAPSSEAYL